MNITDEMVQAAARVIAAEHASDAYSADPSSGEFAPLEREQYEAEAQAVIEVLSPLIIAAQALREAAGQGHPSSPAWSDRTCAACHRRVRVWEGSGQGQQHRVILDPEPTDEGDTVILADRPVGVIREDVVGRYTLYRSHFRNCPKHLIEDAP